MVKWSSQFVLHKQVDLSDEINLEESCKEAEIVLYQEYNWKAIDAYIKTLKSKSKAKPKSNRVKNIQDYFQWNDLTEEEKDVYYDFKKRAEEFWEEQGYDDDNAK